MIEQLLPLYLFGTLILGVFAVAIPSFLVYQNQKQARNKLKHQNELLSTRLDVQEQSMSLISEELHDNIGQLLSITRQYVSGAERNMTDAKGKEQLENAKGILTKAIKEIRHISHSLNSDLIREVGLISFLQKDLEIIADASELNCKFKTEGKEFPIRPEQELIIYRIIQEAVQNVIKHADAKNLEICFVYDNNMDLTILIKDDGIGFDAEEAKQNESLGLKNIMNRAAILNAQLEIQSQQAQGTIIRLHIPLNNGNGK